MTSPLGFRCLLAVGLCAGATVACGSSPMSSANTTVDGPGNTTTSLVIESSTSTAPTPDAISVAVYWTRPYGTARPIDVPGYQDPADGPFPYVLYGSVTNAGSESLDDPEVQVDWSVDGQAIYTTTAPARDPRGELLHELASGAVADLIVVVDDESAASRLADAVPTFTVARP